MKSRTLFALLSLIPTIPLLAGTATVQMNAFKKASGAQLDALPDSVRFGVSFPGAAVSDVTHLVTDPFTPVNDNPQWVAASYRGIVAGTGQVGETGTMLLQLPAPTPPEGSVSPIVAVIPRSGTWEDYNLTPGSTLFDGASGGATFEAGKLTVSVNINGEEHSGVIMTTPTSAGILQIAPFILSAGGSSYSFSAAELQPVGNSFIGEVERLDAGVDYETVLTTLIIGSVSDYDLDGVPDIIDDSVTPWFGPYESYSNGWVTSGFGTMFPFSGSSFVYHEQQGILYIVPQDGYTFLWDNQLGWLFTSLPYYPTIYQYSTGHWLYYSATEDDHRTFWNHTTQEWQYAPISG